MGLNSSYRITYPNATTYIEGGFIYAYKQTKSGDKAVLPQTGKTLASSASAW
jgi:hypothetical protein